MADQAQTQSGTVAGADGAERSARQVVPSNRWDLLDVPQLGGWSPTKKVSVVLPYFQAPEALEITLAALSVQTYPAELLQVIVADDGSNPPLELAEGHRGLDVTVVHQEDLGFGLARARNNGARAADGEILVFMDCDMVPEPWQVEAHARWHHVCDHAATLGFRRHVEFDEVGPDEVAEVGAAGLAPLFADREQQVPQWLEHHMERLDELRTADDDLFRAVTGGNLGVLADTYWSVGGSDESFTQWGGEDTELGFRLFTDGVLLVPEREAMCWHQGYGHEPDESEWRSLDQQRAKMSHLIAHHGFRRLKPGRIYAIPRISVEVDGTGADHELIVATVESVLASYLHDLAVILRVDEGHPARIEIGHDLGGDPRVWLEPHPEAARIPLTLKLPAGALLERRTLNKLLAVCANADEPAGVIRLTIPDRPPAEAVATVVKRRAHQRARRLAADGDYVGPGSTASAGVRGADVPDSDVDTIQAAALFGQKWMSGLDLEIVWSGCEELLRLPKPAELAPETTDPVTPKSALQQRAAALLAPAVAPVRRRVQKPARWIKSRVLIRSRALGNAFGELSRVRRPKDLVRVGATFGRAVLPHSVVVKMRRALPPSVASHLGSDIPGADNPGLKAPGFNGAASIDRDSGGET